jgi:enhancing lycopene biosynthesis protein 2
MKTAVILSGAGVYDGAEIHESVFTMLALDKANVSSQLFAPNIEQTSVINHLTGENQDEKRNVLVESARIARGNIKDTKELNISEFDAIIFPGGFGVAKNLCDYAYKGAEIKINPEIEKLIVVAHTQGKIIGAMCISPVMIAKALNGINVTIGQDTQTAEHIEEFGASHTKTNIDEVIVDSKNKIVTTACYMLDARISEIAQGAENLVNKVIELAKS